MLNTTKVYGGKTFNIGYMSWGLKTRIGKNYLLWQKLPVCENLHSSKKGSVCFFFNNGTLIDYQIGVHMLFGWGRADRRLFGDGNLSARPVYGMVNLALKSPFLCTS